MTVPIAVVVDRAAGRYAFYGRKENLMGPEEDFDCRLRDK